jgi:hypothetical protein
MSVRRAQRIASAATLPARTPGGGDAIDLVVAFINQGALMRCGKKVDLQRS